MGIMVQNMTYTVTVPLYLILHTLTSPVAQPGTASAIDTVAADASDLALLPVSNMLAFGIPAVMMYLPSPAIVAPLAHYAWDAAWQPFPATQNAVQRLLKALFGAPPVARAGTGKAHLDTAGYAYRYVVALCTVSQVVLLAVALTPASAVPAQWAPVFEEIGFASAFIPYWPSNIPAVEVTALSATGHGGAALVKLFFQWDIYCGGLAILLWALYVHGVAVPGRSLAGLLARVVAWTLLAGPTGAAAIVLWERDQAVLGAKGKKA